MNLFQTLKIFEFIFEYLGKLAGAGTRAGTAQK
jgi:hypothetical protein